LQETDGSNAVQAEYTNTANQFGDLISQSRKSGLIWTPNYHLFDALGSTRILLAGNQAASDTYLYDAFGNVLSVSGTTANPFRFIGHLGYYYDADCENYYVREREYRPSIIVWLSADPLGFYAGDENWYRYVANSATNSTDPSGLIYPGGGRPRKNPAPPEMPKFEWYIQSSCWLSCWGSWKIFAGGRPPVAAVAAFACHDIGLAEGRKVNPDDNADPNIEIRHCVGAACLATNVGCECAACLGLAREKWQYLLFRTLGKATPGANDLLGARRGNCNNQKGLRLAGCTGRYAADGDAIRLSPVPYVEKCKKLQCEGKLIPQRGDCGTSGIQDPDRTFRRDW
jgi:RHS repeat-associated protein